MFLDSSGKKKPLTFAFTINLRVIRPSDTDRVADRVDLVEGELSPPQGNLGNP